MQRIGGAEFTKGGVSNPSDYPSTLAPVPLVLLRSDTFRQNWVTELDMIQMGIGVQLALRNGQVVIASMSCDVDSSLGACPPGDTMPGDILLAVNGVPTDSDLNKANSMIYGLASRTLILSLLRGTTPLQDEVRRDYIETGFSKPFRTEVVQGKETTFIRFIPTQGLPPGLYCYQFDNLDHVGSERSQVACFNILQGTPSQAQQSTPTPLPQVDASSFLPDGLTSGYWVSTDDKGSELAPALIGRDGQMYFWGMITRSKRLDNKTAEVCEEGGAKRCLTITVEQVLDGGNRVQLTLAAKSGFESSSDQSPLKMTLEKKSADTSSGNLAQDIQGTWDDPTNPGNQVLITQDTISTKYIQYSYAWVDGALTLITNQNQYAGNVICTGNAMLIWGPDMGLGIFVTRAQP
jgi:hypothetical protein